MPCLLVLFGIFVSAAGEARAGDVGVMAIAAQDVDESTPVPVPSPSALALRYHRTGNALWVLARLWDFAVPFTLLVTGASARLRDLARRVGRSWFLTTVVYLVLFLVILYLAELPLRYYAGFVRQHAYGLSRQSFGKWLGDSLKGLAVDAVGVALVGWVPFFLIARVPRWWWLVTGLLTVPFAAFVMLIAPVWIDPLFNDFGPMKDKALEQKILALAGRAGIPADRVFEVNKSVDTKTANAYVKGLFGTHRIVLWDTLVDNFDDREVLAVIGHEIGHYVLHHVAWTLALSSVVLIAGLFWTDRAGRWLIARYHRRFGFDSLADVAATPLILILLGISSTVLGPVALAYSRYHEREADRFSLELTHMNRSAARAFADFQRENLSVPRPSLVYKIWRSTHPSIAERIEFCNTYKPWVEPPTSGPPRRERFRTTFPDSHGEDADNNSEEEVDSGGQADSPCQDGRKLP
jgi:STE24 endopeptidase